MASREPTTITPDYLREHYGYELKVLLVAATTWTAWKTVEHDRSLFPPFGIDLTQDSAFLHARNLYELLVVEHERKRERRTLGLAKPLKRRLYTREFEKSLHEKLFHPSSERSSAPTGTAADRMVEQVGEVADDVLALWDELGETTSDEFRPAVREARCRAIEDAREAAVRHRIEVRFS